MAKKEATTAAQFELLITEMEKYPDVARGTPTFGSSRARVDNIWDSTSKLLNAIGPPVRAPSKWRKVWTDYRGRFKKKLSQNKSSIRKTGGGPSEYIELTPIEKTIESIVNTRIAANPTGNVYGVKVASTNGAAENMTNSYPLTPLNETLASSESSQQSQNLASTPDAEPLSGIETVLNEEPLTPVKVPTIKQTFSLKKRRQIKKDEERKKLIRLTEKQTDEIVKQTLAIEKLTAAIEAQTEILKKKIYE